MPQFIIAKGSTMNKHHLIPKSLESHPVLIFLRANGGFDIDRADNLLMLPSESKAAQAVGAALDVGLR
jgi:hypothetical protein